MVTYVSLRTVASPILINDDPLLPDLASNFLHTIHVKHDGLKHYMKFETGTKSVKNDHKGSPK